MENYSLYDNYTLEELIKAKTKLNSDSKPERLDYLNKLIAKKQRAKRSSEIDKPAVHASTAQASTEIKKPTVENSITDVNGLKHQPLKAKSPVIFHGKTGEYYSIWIVNILLSIVTLGIYSAWAKVRTQRYFHANTEVDGHRFSYLANPIQILKGRIIALALFVGFYLVSSMSAGIGILLAITYVFAVPWLLCKSLKFNMQMIGYRNIRFNFHGKYIKALLVFMVYPILSVFTLYLALPLVLKTIDKFICDHISYGDKKFQSNLSVSTYYKASFGAVLIGVVMFVAAIVFSGVEMATLANMQQQPTTALFPMILMATYLAVFIISGAFYTKVVRNHLYNNTQMEGIASFTSNVSLASLIWLNFSNLIVLICTLGLALPWVKVRSTNFFCKVTEVAILPGINAVIADNSTGVNAIGDEISEVFDFDVALG